MPLQLLDTSNKILLTAVIYLRGGKSVCIRSDKIPECDGQKSHVSIKRQYADAR